MIGFVFTDESVDQAWSTIDIETDGYQLPDASNPLDNFALGANTGTMTSALAQAIFGGDYPVSAILVSYNENTPTDQYGDAKWVPMIVYNMDKGSYQQINWATLDPNKLCQLLHEAHPETAGANCAEQLNNG